MDAEILAGKEVPEDSQLFKESMDKIKSDQTDPDDLSVGSKVFDYARTPNPSEVI